MFQDIHQICTSHLYPFSNKIKINDLIRSIYWTKYTYQVDDMRYDSRIVIQILISLYFVIETLIFLLTLPISFSIFHILNHFNIINEIFADAISICYYEFYYFLSKKINSVFPEIPQRTITFIIPYIKFVCYPQDYKWWWELIKPKPSPFVKTITNDIYKTWNGEALINFKWNLYGKYYYAIIWIVFTALLGCFTTATTISEDLISDDIRKRLLIVSIILGFIHSMCEFRQFIYDPIKWFRDPWNYFGKNIDLQYLFIINFTNICVYI